MNKSDTISVFSTKLVGKGNVGLFGEECKEVSIKTLKEIPFDWAKILIDNHLEDKYLEALEQTDVYTYGPLVSEFEAIKYGKPRESITSQQEAKRDEILLSLLPNSDDSPVEVIRYYTCTSSPQVFGLKALEEGISDNNYPLKILNVILPQICKNESIDMSSIKTINLVLHDKDVSIKAYHKDLIQAKPKDVERWTKALDYFTNDKVIYHIVFFKHQLNAIVSILRDASGKIDVHGELNRIISADSEMRTAYQEAILLKSYKDLNK